MEADGRGGTNLYPMGDPHQQQRLQHWNLCHSFLVAPPHQNVSVILALIRVVDSGGARKVWGALFQYCTSLGWHQMLLGSIVPHGVSELYPLREG